MSWDAWREIEQALDKASQLIGDARALAESARIAAAVEEEAEDD